MHQMKRSALGLALALGLSGGAFAGTLVGEHVTFTYDDALLSLFGSPSVSGDTIYFLPTSFTAKSLDGVATALTSATLNIGVTANAGYKVSGVDFTEQGDYMLFSPVAPSDLGVGVTGQIRVRDTTTLTEMTSSIATTGPLTAVGPSSVNWTANADASFDCWKSQSVNMTIENILFAYTTAAPSVAFIEKKFVGAEFSVTAVPEPETYAMMLAGLGMLGVVARRRRA